MADGKHLGRHDERAIELELAQQNAARKASAMRYELRAEPYRQGVFVEEQRSGQLHVENETYLRRGLQA